MKRIALILAASFLLIGFSDVYSQNLKRFVSKKSNTASEAAGERVDQETDTLVVKGVNKGISQIKGKFFGTKSSQDQGDEYQGDIVQDGDEDQSENELYGSEEDSDDYQESSSANSAYGTAFLGAMGMSGNVETKESYEFDAYVQMEVSTYKKSGDLGESSKYDTYNSAESMSYAMVFYDNSDVMTMIIDAENHAMLTLVESGGEKTGFAVAYEEETFEETIEEDLEDAAEEEVFDPSNAPKKTGNTKTILGYKCDEYFVDDQEAEVRIWVADGLKAKSQKEVMKNSLFAGWFLHAAYFDGMVLEYDIRDKESEEKVIMQVTDLDLEKKHSLSTRGYNIMSMGEMMEE